MRLYRAGSATNTRFAYDGSDLIAEYDANGTLVKRYVHGPGVDEPLVEYLGTDVYTRRWLHADERGSIVAVTNTGGTIAYNSYDEYGKPAASNVGRFQYTGQTWLPEIGRYYYKARMYDAGDGRLDQTDTIGYGGGTNLYEYADSNPVNLTDPEGTCPVCKVGVDFALEVGIQYVTTGDVDLIQAAKNAAVGAVNPLKTVERARDLGRALKGTDSVKAKIAPGKAFTRAQKRDSQQGAQRWSASFGQEWTATRAFTKITERRDTSVE